MGIEERRQREREARRVLILDAAERVIAERGLWATTMEDVASAAELSKGTLYLYFDNKDALCAALAARSIGSLDLGEVMAKEPTGLAKLQAGMEAQAGFLKERPHLVRLAVSWMLTGVQATDSTEFQTYRQRIGTAMGHAVEAIEHGRRDGSIRSNAVPELLALALWTGLLGTLITVADPRDLAQRMPVAVDGDALIACYIENALRGLRGDPSSSVDPNESPS